MQNSPKLFLPRALAASLLSGGCALMNAANDPVSAVQSIPGLVESLNEIKTVSNIKRSFVFRTAELLFPGGLTTTPEQLPVLSARQQEQLSDFLSQRISGIQALAGRLVSQHPQYRTLQTTAPQFKRVKFLVTGQPEAVVDDAGVAFIDLRIVQAVLRSVIIHWQRSGGMDSGAGMFSMLLGPRRGDFGPDAKPLTAAQEAEAIAEFNRFSAAIAKAAPNMEIGVWWKALTQPAGDSPFGTKDGDGLLDKMLDRMMGGLIAQMDEAGMLAAARYAQETFESSLDFLVAHELAHQAFGHSATRAVVPASLNADTCTAWQAQEMQADEFAAVLLIQRQLAESKANTIVEKANGFESRVDGHEPSVDGRTLFLSTAYGLAGFDGTLDPGGCKYPPVRQRIARLDSVFAYADAGRSMGLHYEGLLRGDWLRRRDDARLPQLLSAAEKSLLPSDGSTRPVPERIVALVQPLMETRFRGKI